MTRMGVTELACFRIPPDVDLSHPPLVRILKDGSRIMSSFNESKGTPKTFYFLQQIEDPKCIYILGDWNSVAEHHEFIATPENAAAMAKMKELGLDLVYFGHLDCPQNEIPTGAEVVSIGTHRIEAKKRAAFDKTFKDVKGYLDQYVGEARKTVGGWRIDLSDSDKEAGIEEFVLFGGWDSVDQHIKGFTSSDGFSEYRRIADHVGEFDVKHASLLDLSQLATGGSS